MKQVYESYTEEDRAVWRLLYNKQEERLRKGASQAYLKGLELVGFQSEDLPVFEHINSVLHKSTHWQLAVVPGIVPDYTFFELMSQRHFPATTWLRTLAEVDYLEEPDMFHDVFAHRLYPLLTRIYLFHQLCFGAE